jgi:membrane protein DedA with SNARE-associated domain
VSVYLAIVAAALVVLGGAQAGGLINLPFAGWFCGPSGSVVSSGALKDFLTKYGYASLFVLMLAESASAPLPSEVVLPFAGYLSYTGALGNLAILLVVSTAAALVGALLDYYLALYLGRPFVEGILRAFRVEPSRLERAGAWFEKSGRWTVFAARFVPLVRALISFPAGLFEMGLGEFVVMTTIGCAIWNAILLYAGYTLGQAVCSGSNSAFVVSGFALVVAIASGAYLAYFASAAVREAHESQAKAAA